MDLTGRIAVFAAYIVFWIAILVLSCMAVPRRQRGQNRKKYDERQRYERGRACQYAYITLIVYLVADRILRDAFGAVWCDDTFGLCLGLAISGSVFLAGCVFQDAFFDLLTGRREAMLGVNLLGIFPLFRGILGICEGSVLENGILTRRAAHFLPVTVIVLLDLFVVIRRRVDRRSD